MKIFELELGMTATGLKENVDGLKAVEAAGEQAAGSLTGVEAASRAVAAATQAAAAAGERAAAAFEAAGLKLDRTAFNKGLARGIADGFREIEAAAETASGPGLGTFNQQLEHTTTHAAGSTRGLYLLDRGLGSIIGSTVGATSGFERLGEGLLMVSAGGHTATLVMAAIAVPLIALVGTYELLTKAQRDVQDEFDASYKKFADQKAGADALASAWMGYVQALDEAAKAQERLAALRPPAPPGEPPLPKDVGAFIGGQSKFPILGPGISGLVGIIAARYEDAKATEAETAATRALNDAQLQQIAQSEKEAGTLRDLIANGVDVADNKQRLTEVERALSGQVASHVAAVIKQNQAIFPQLTTIPELIAARKREIDMLVQQSREESENGRVRDETKAKLREASDALAALEAAYRITDAAVKTITTDTRELAAAEREAAQPGVALAQTLVDLMKLGVASAADRRLAITLEQAYAKAAKDTNLSIEVRRMLAGAAKSIENELTSETRQATQAQKDRLEAEKQQNRQLVDNARLAVEQLHTFGATTENLAALKTAVLALATATDAEHAANLRKKGLLEVLIALTKELRSSSEELAKVEDRISQIPFRPATFGLGTVTRAASGMPVQFGQGLSVGAGTVGAPSRPLTGGLGEGFGGTGTAAGPSIGPIPFLPPTNAFDRALTEFDRNMERTRARVKQQGQIIKAEMVDQAVDLSRAFERAMEDAFVSLAQIFGDLFANIFKGANKADIGKEVLAALGGIFVRLGEAMIAASPIFKALAAAMHNPFTAGPALLAYGAALVALGTALGAIATGSGGTASTAGGGGAGANQPIRVIIVDSATRRAFGIPQPNLTQYGPNTFIGVTDPKGQASVARMVQLGQRRNLPSGI